VIPRFRSRSEQALDHGSRREDLAQEELAAAIAAAAAQQERALAAERAVQEGLDALRELLAGGGALHHLRERHEELSLARSSAGRERHALARLEGLADQRRAELAPDELAGRRAARARAA
jgi:hypothetical protein